MAFEIGRSKDVAILTYFFFVLLLLFPPPPSLSSSVGHGRRGEKNRHTHKVVVSS